MEQSEKLVGNECNDFLDENDWLIKIVFILKEFDTFLVWNF